jgi:hypothetical protein
VPDQKVERLAKKHGPKSVAAKVLTELRTQRSTDRQVLAFRYGWSSQQKRYARALAAVHRSARPRFCSDSGSYQRDLLRQGVSLGLAHLRARDVQLITADGHDLTSDKDEMTEAMLAIGAVFAGLEKKRLVLSGSETYRRPLMHSVRASTTTLRAHMSSRMC